MPKIEPRKANAGTGHPNGDPRYKVIDRVLKRNQFQQDALIEVLTSVQETFGYLPEEVMVYVARQLKLPYSWVYGVATFYHFFSLKPQGEHTCIVCTGTACYVGKSAEIVAVIENEFNVKAGHTTEDGKLTLSTTRCLGSCGLAPVVVLGDRVLGKQTPERAVGEIRALVGGGGGRGESESAVNDESVREEKAAP